MFYRPTSTWSWVLLVTTVLEIGTVLTLEIVIFATFQLALLPSKNLPAATKIIPTILSLMIFGFIYLVLLLYDTLANKNTIQLFGLSFFAASLFGYTFIQIDEVNKGIQNLRAYDAFSQTALAAKIHSMTTATAVLTGLYTVTTMFVGFKLYSEFQWTVYRLLNADLAMQRRYFTFKIFTTILKFDFFFFLGFIIQLLTVTPVLVPVETALSIIAMPLILLTLTASTWFARREHKIGALIVVFLHVVLMAIFIFKFSRMYQTSQQLEYLAARKNLTYFGTLTIFLSFVTIAFALICISNFDKGLKIHISSQRLRPGLLEDHEMELSEFGGPS